MEYISIKKRVRTEFIVKKSKFICDIAPFPSLKEAKEFLKEIKQEFSNATHHCYAYIGLPDSVEIEFKDDKEPTGTAGLPILNILKANDLKAVIAVVTRYFGGVKLGASGLSAAYAKATQQAIDQVDHAYMKKAYLVELKLDYPNYDILKNSKECDIKIVQVDYSEAVSLKCAVPIDEYEKFKSLLSQITSSSDNLVELNVDYFDFDTA